MIIGGIDGVSRTGEGGLITGYRELYLHGLVSVGTEPLDEVFTENRPIRYTASLSVQDEFGDFIEVSDVSYFQVSENIDGTGSANFTVRKSETWSPSGTTYAELLSPSDTIIQITVKLVSGSAEFELPIFTGQISSISEAHGQRGGALSVVAKIATSALQLRPTEGLERLTVYRRTLDELSESGLFQDEQVPVVLFADREIITQTSFNSLLSLIEGIAPNAVDVLTGISGNVIVKQRGSEESQGNQFTIGDNNQTAVTRSVGSLSSFNSVDVIGLDESDELVTQRVQDAADVAKRGVVLYGRLFGNPDGEIAGNVSAAEILIAESIRGKISITCRLNPFIRAATVINFSSERLFIESGKIRVGAVTHRYRHGSSSTQISRAAIIE